MRGKFIVLDGIDGSGKSSQIETVANALRARGIEVLVTREPGGTAVSEKIRSLLLSENMLPLSEVLLVFAARHEHLQNVILPALEKGIWVVCDRFTFSTYAYQGAGRGAPFHVIESLEKEIVGQKLKPDLTFVFDIPEGVAKARRESRSEKQDVYEQKGDEFFSRVKNEYLNRAKGADISVCVLDSSKSMEEVSWMIVNCLKAVCRI